MACIPQDQEGKPKRVDIHDNKDGTYTVTYVPDKTGRYTIGVKYGGDDIPSSPYRIRASPAGDASKCLATGELLLFVLGIKLPSERGTVEIVGGEYARDSCNLAALTRGAFLKIKKHPPCRSAGVSCGLYQNLSNCLGCYKQPDATKG